MNILTKAYDSGIVTLDAENFKPLAQEAIDAEISASPLLKAVVERLYEYEDAEENGLLKRLPCKVGDTVYELSRWCDGSHGDCDKRPCNECPEYETKIYTTKFTYEMLKKVGKTVFLTQAEAEQALKERR